ncbi:MAG: extracellular solute-binding protein [Promethearchaeota archaeon]
MTKKYNIKAVIVLLSLLSLMTTTFFLFPINVYSKPETSQLVDLTIVVTDQQMPGVENVTDDFLSSPLGSGVNTVDVISSGTTANEQLVFLQTLMAADTATAHVIGLDVVWTALFASNGWIRNLDSYLTAGEMDDYVAGLVDAGTYQGHLYAYPYFNNLGILFYRTDILDTHFGVGGWSEADFDTWEELNATANFVLNNGSGLLTTADADLVGYVGQFDAYEGGVVNFFEWCGSNGVLDVVTSDGTVNADDPDVAYAMQFLKDLIPGQYTGVQGNLTDTDPPIGPNSDYNNYIIPRSGLVHDEGSSVGVWYAENTIFMRQWPFPYGQSVSDGISFGLAPLPHFAGATGYRTSAVGGAILAIPTATSGADELEAAVNLTKFLGDTVAQEAELTSDSSADPGVQPLSNFPALMSVYSSPPAGFEWIENWTDQLPLTLSRPVHQDYPLISNTIADYFSDLLSCQKSVDDALTEMQRDLEEIVAGRPEVPGIPGFSIAILILSTAFTIGIIALLRRKNK